MEVYIFSPADCADAADINEEALEGNLRHLRNLWEKIS